MGFPLSRKLLTMWFFFFLNKKKYKEEVSLLKFQRGFWEVVSLPKMVKRMHLVYYQRRFECRDLRLYFIRIRIILDWIIARAFLFAFLLSVILILNGLIHPFNFFRVDDFAFKESWKFFTSVPSGVMLVAVLLFRLWISRLRKDISLGCQLKWTNLRETRSILDVLGVSVSFFTKVFRLLGQKLTPTDLLIIHPEIHQCAIPRSETN